MSSCMRGEGDPFGREKEADVGADRDGVREHFTAVNRRGGSEAGKFIRELHRGVPRQLRNSAAPFAYGF